MGKKKTQSFSTTEDRAPARTAPKRPSPLPAQKIALLGWSGGFTVLQHKQNRQRCKEGLWKQRKLGVTTSACLQQPPHALAVPCSSSLWGWGQGDGQLTATRD